MRDTVNATRNTLPAAAREISIELLNGAVADLFDLYARTKQAHWNVRGRSFFALHRLLDEFAARLQQSIDAAAERVTALGGYVEGTLRETALHPRLKKAEEPALKSGERDWVRELASVHAECGDHIRAAIERVTAAKDFATADLLTDLRWDLDKQLWILEAHLNRSDARERHASHDEHQTFAH
jgi:starvation-inducible DNA-binding protein